MKKWMIFFLLITKLSASQRINGEKYAVGSYTKIYGKHERMSRQYIFNVIDSNLMFSYFIHKNNCDECQYFILDGDTIDYYDAKGMKQGEFISFCSYFGKYDFASCGSDEYCQCEECSFIEERSKFRNDTLISRISLGYVKNKIIDTLTIHVYEYKNNRIYTRFRNEKGGFYWVGYKDMSGNRQGLIRKYDLKTKNLIEEGYYKDNEYDGKVTHYFENGKLMAEEIYDNPNKKVFARFYSEYNGKKYAEVYVKDFKITSKICFDEKGKKLPACDSTKTLTGRSKLPR